MFMFQIFYIHFIVCTVKHKFLESLKNFQTKKKSRGKNNRNSWRQKTILYRTANNQKKWFMQSSNSIMISVCLKDLEKLEWKKAKKRRGGKRNGLRRFVGIFIEFLWFLWFYYWFCLVCMYSSKVILFSQFSRTSSCSLSLWIFKMSLEIIVHTTFLYKVFFIC